MARWVSFALSSALTAALAAPAEARCPYDGVPSKKVCENVLAWFVPGVVAMGYRPASTDGRGWVGAGVQLAPVLWSHNTEKFGPGQGKVVFEVALLDDDDDATGTMLLYRFGGQLAFERNASRAFAVPFFGFTFGGLTERTIDHHAFVEASLGLHALHLRNFVLTLEGGYLFPFDRVDDLAGWRATVAANFTLW